MLLEKTGSLAAEPKPLRLAEILRPEPGGNEVLLRISACGVCHTELDEIEGRTPPSVLPIVPGHQAVGRVVSRGEHVSLLEIGDRVGVGWIFSSSGGDRENISSDFVATGRDVNGGYAEYMVVGERYAHRIPDSFSDYEAAPLLCAGSVGYRALSLANIRNGEALGLTGFGGSGHLVLQLARHLYPDSDVYVFARNPEEQEFARDLGATWAGDTQESPPQKPRAIIDTTPAWLPVLAALKCLQPGGRLVINAIRKEDKDKSLLAEIDYATHLWQEKQLQTVANVTSNDIAAFLKLADEAGIRPEIQIYGLAEANVALRELKGGMIRGAKVLAVADDDSSSA